MASTSADADRRAKEKEAERKKKRNKNEGDEEEKKKEKFTIPVRKEKRKTSEQTNEQSGKENTQREAKHKKLYYLLPQKKPREEENGRMETTGRRCFICDTPGHFARQCNRRPAESTRGNYRGRGRGGFRGERTGPMPEEARRLYEMETQLKVRK